MKFLKTLLMTILIITNIVCVMSTVSFGEDEKSHKYFLEISTKWLQSFVTEDDCYEVGAENCDNLIHSDYYKTCTYPCLLNGPELLTIDNKSKKIYFTNQLGLGGSGGAYAILFMADPHEKSIKKLGITHDETGKALSPSGSTLAIAVKTTIQFFRPSENKKFEINFAKPSTYKFNEPYNPDKDPKYLITSLKWLIENRLQFNEEKYENKWSNKPLTITQKIMEIDFQNQTGKIISEKIMKMS